MVLQPLQLHIVVPLRVVGQGSPEDQIKGRKANGGLHGTANQRHGSVTGAMGITHVAGRELLQLLGSEDRILSPRSVKSIKKPWSVASS